MVFYATFQSVECFSFKYHVTFILQQFCICSKGLFSVSQFRAPEN